MSCVAFPLRLSAGLLQRQGEVESFLSLLRVMARTPVGSWKSCRAFGLRDYLEDSRKRPELLQVAAEAANRTLSELGISRFRIESIEREPEQESGTAAYNVFVSHAGTTQVLSIET
jgi:hypothetical protein